MWICSMETLPYAVMHPTYDKATDSILMYCATVGQRTEQYPWDPCYLCIKRMSFIIPTLQQLSLASVSSSLNLAKIFDESSLPLIGLTPNFTSFLWARVNILKCFNEKNKIV